MWYDLFTKDSSFPLVPIFTILYILLSAIKSRNSNKLDKSILYFGIESLVLMTTLGFLKINTIYYIGILFIHFLIRSYLLFTRKLK